MTAEGTVQRLIRLTQALTETLDLPAVLRRVAEATIEFVPDSASRIWTIDGNALTLAAEAGRLSPDDDTGRTTLALGEGWVGHVALVGEPLVVDDIASDARGVNRQWMQRQRFVSAVTVPLRVNRETAGALVVLTRTPHRFSRGELDLLTGFAAHAATALRNATLFTEAERRRRVAEALATLSRSMSQSLELDEVGQRILDSVQTLFGASAAVLYRWEADLKDVEAVALAGDWGSTLDHAVFPAGTGVTGVALAQRRTVATADVLADTAIALPAAARARFATSASRAMLSLPLIMRDRIIGALALARTTGWVFTAEEIRLAETFGDQAAIALANAAMFEEQVVMVRTLRARRARVQALLDVTREVSRIQPLPTLLQRVATTCGELLETDSVGIRLVEGDELVVAYTSGGARDVMATPRLKIGESLSGLVAATGQTLQLTEPGRDPRLAPAHREAMVRLGYRGLLAVPIRIGARIAGVLSVQTRRPEGFADEDVAIVSAFAEQVGVALHNSHLYAELQHAYEQVSRTQDQLVQAQKMEAVGRLAGGIAHDFNNLLTIVTGQTHLLRRCVPAEASDGIDRIEMATDRAAELVRQLLAFSRKQVMQPVVLDPNAVVTALASMLQPTIGEDIELTVRLEPALGRVRVDPSQLEQVLMNLAVNARDAMPGGGQLTFETANVVLDASYAAEHRDVQPGPYVMLAVTDTGVGMDAETRRRLFEPFFTTKENGKGTGLGLATVYGVVRQSGGHVWVYSEVGHGTTFKIYLPAVCAELEPRPRTDADAERPPGTETVLVVEDEDEVRRLLCRTLRECGYTVLDAARPQEALTLVEANRIDLLVTDVVMPQMSGRVLADLLTDAIPALRVLFVSGYAEQAVFQHGMVRGQWPYLAKPFSPDQLARAVRRALDAPAP